MSHDTPPTIIINKSMQKAHAKKMRQVANISNKTNHNKIDTTDDLPKVTTVGKDIGQLISTTRNAKHMTQSDLAKQLNIKSDVIRDYENGTAQRNGNLLNKMGQLLGIKLTGKNINSL